MRLTTCWVQNEDGKSFAGGRLPEGVDGIARFHDLVGGHVDEPGRLVNRIETERGPFVAAPRRGRLCGLPREPDVDVEVSLPTRDIESYLAALAALGDPTTTEALKVPPGGPHPGARLHPTALEDRRPHRRAEARRIDERATETQTAAARPQTRRPRRHLDRHGSLSQRQRRRRRPPAVLAEELEGGFDEHPDVEAVRSPPGRTTMLSAGHGSCSLRHRSG